MCSQDGLYFPEVQTRFILSNYDLNDPSMSVPRCQTIPQKESLCFPELTYPRKDSADGEGWLALDVSISLMGFSSHSEPCERPHGPNPVGTSSLTRGLRIPREDWNVSFSC